MTRPSLGFVGIGIMGAAMTLRLLERGWTVRVWNLEPERLDLVVPQGAVAASSPADVVRHCDIVLLCVLDTAAVQDCVFGPGGLLSSEACCRGKLVVDLSTIDPDATREIAARAEGHGLGWIDAPVSGGPDGARSGSLAIMVGGSPDDFARAGPALADLGASVTLMGPVGAGQTTKMVNQAIVGTGFAMMAEAAHLAEASGIDAARLPECLAGGFADGALLRRLYPRIVERAFDPPAAYSRQLLKDLRAVEAFAASAGCRLPLVAAARERYEAYVAQGSALKDPASLIELYESDRGRG